MEKRVLITGGAGFLGSNLVQGCLNEGWHVSILYLPEFGLSQVEKYLHKIDAIPVDNSTESVISAIKNSNPDLVFHLASVFIAQHSSEDILRLIQSNILFGTQVLEGLSVNRVKYFVNTGTSWEYYNSSDYNPVNLYAATKHAYEKIVDYYVQSGKIQVVTLKLFDTYGFGDPRPKLFNLLKKSTCDGTRLEMSVGDQLIDVVHVDDVVSAFIISAKRLFDQKVVSHEKYAISSGNPIKLRDLVNLFQEISGKHLEIIWGGKPYREREVMIPWQFGKQLPGWSPKIDLQKGISTVLDK